MNFSEVVKLLDESETELANRNLNKIYTKEFFESLQYTNVRQIDGRWYGIVRMIFTCGVFCDLDGVGPRNGRICFNGLYDAVRFLESWDGKTAPTEADGLTKDKRLDKEEPSE